MIVAVVAPLFQPRRWASKNALVAVVPLWPNLTEIPRILGAEVVRVPLQPDEQGLWQLDLERLLAELTPGTRAVIINSPANPTGWTMTAGQWQAVVERKAGSVRNAVAGQQIARGTGHLAAVAERRMGALRPVAQVRAVARPRVAQAQGIRLPLVLPVCGQNAGVAPQTA